MSNALDFLGPIKGMATKMLKKELEKKGIKSLILVYDKKPGAGDQDIEDFSAHMFTENVYDILNKKGTSDKDKKEIERLKKRNDFLEPFYKKYMEL